MKNNKIPLSLKERASRKVFNGLFQMANRDIFSGEKSCNALHFRGQEKNDLKQTSLCWEKSKVFPINNHDSALIQS